MTAILYEDVCTFVIISQWILLRIRNVLDKSCKKKKKSILCSLKFFFKENLSINETNWKNIV
jgi:hypothetical protein